MQKFAKDSTAIVKFTPEQHRVTQLCGTEPPGTGAYLHNKQPGIYVEKDCYGAYLDQVGGKP